MGIVFGFTPVISQNPNTFFSDLTTVTFPFGSPGSTVSLFAPAHPAVMNFLLGVGVLQIVILALRLAVHSRIRRIAQSVGDLIFWLGAAVLTNVFLIAGTQSGWFQFWASLIVLIGILCCTVFRVSLEKELMSNKNKQKTKDYSITHLHENQNLGFLALLSGQ